MTKIVPEEKAKQGRSGYRILTILIASLLLLSIGWYAVEQYGDVIEAPQTRTDPGG